MKKIKRNKLISGGASESEGRWITKNGAHVFIKNKRLYEDNNEAPKLSKSNFFDDESKPFKNIQLFDKPNSDNYLHINDVTKTLNKARKKSLAEAQKVFAEMVEKGQIDLNVVKGLQDKHIEGTHNYKQEVENGRLPSILTADAKGLVKKHAGKGVLLFNKQGQWTQKEKFSDLKAIGINRNKRFSITEKTKNGIIHYSNKGVHIVPDKKERKKND